MRIILPILFVILLIISCSDSSKKSNNDINKMKIIPTNSFRSDLIYYSVEWNRKITKSAGNYMVLSRSNSDFLQVSISFIAPEGAVFEKTQSTSIPTKLENKSSHRNNHRRNGIVFSQKPKNSINQSINFICTNCKDTVLHNNYDIVHTIVLDEFHKHRIDYADDLNHDWEISVPIEIDFNGLKNKDKSNLEEPVRNTKIIVTSGGG